MKTGLFVCQIYFYIKRNVFELLQKKHLLNHLVHVLNSFFGELQFKLNDSFNMQISLKI